jgi:hypothetical protein
MSDRRYQIFISSTFSDLRAERKAAVEAVYERGHIPLAVENFSASNQTDLEVIRRAMENSQVYILILGHRYGSMARDLDISYTEFEYNLALEYKLMPLVFILDRKTIDERRKQLDPQITEDKAELERFPKLLAFHERIEGVKKVFAPGAEFKFLVELALADNLSNWDKPGFIREPDDPAVLKGARNEFIGDLVSELTSFQLLYDRTQREAAKKRELARFFMENYMDRLIESKSSLFFESGSTVAFLAKEMGMALKNIVELTVDGSANIQISTNNVLAYLLLWLRARIPCSKFPWSPPVEAKFGAAYGGIENLQELQPDYRMTPLPDSAKRAIERLDNAPYSLRKMRTPTLLLGAASGLKLSGQNELLFSVDVGPERKRALEEQISLCFGPHVGSYHNKVFKRYMYFTGLPVMIFLTAEKIDSPIKVGNCHFILDSDFDWGRFAQHHPLAFCIAGTEDEVARCAPLFEKAGFALKVQESTSSITCFVARNKVFISQFEDQLGAKAVSALA